MKFSNITVANFPQFHEIDIQDWFVVSVFMHDKYKMSRFLKYACIIFITISLLMKQNNGQRLSQGASDWYMRFHSNFRHVKRDVDPPEIKSFLVSSTINVIIDIYKINSNLFESLLISLVFQRQTYSLCHCFPFSASILNYGS